MSKLILTESQFRRLKKRLIDETINEADYGGLGYGLVLGGLVGVAYQMYAAAGGSYDGVKKLFDVCKSKGIGGSTMNDGTLDAIADKLKVAISGMGTDEDAIKSAFSQVQTIPDFCAVNKRYSENYPGFTLLDDLDGDLDADSEWNEYVFLPLNKGRRKTEELSKKGGAGQGFGASSVGGGKSYTQQNNYTLTSDGGKPLNIPKGTGYSYKPDKKGASFKVGDQFGWFGCQSKMFQVGGVKYKDPKGFLANNIAKGICG